MLSPPTFEPRRDKLVAIDSDGCVFDTMEAKQSDCFFPETVRHWGLEPAWEVARETAAFVGLYSAWRGQNRFHALVKTLELLAERREVQDAGISLPKLDPIRTYLSSGVALSNDTLREAAERSRHPDLCRLLHWSEAVDRAIADRARNLPPFPGVPEAIELLAESADLIVCSQTPIRTLIEEWRHHDLLRFVRGVFGPEHGTKADHLLLAANSHYASDAVLLIGDAPGDLRAARSVEACFFPIHPGDEVASWQRLQEEAFPLFLSGRYQGAYQQARVAEYEALLPKIPPWHNPERR